VNTSSSDPRPLKRHLRRLRRLLLPTLLLACLAFAPISSAATRSIAKSNAILPGDIATIAGNNTQNYGGDGGPALAASFDFASGGQEDGAELAFDTSGNILVNDRGNQRVRLIARASSSPLLPSQPLTPGYVYTVAGNGSGGYSGDNGPAPEANLNSPDGLAVDALGNLFIADNGNDVVRMVAATTSDPFLPGVALTPGFIYTVVGNNSSGYSDDVAASAASLGAPQGLLFDAQGNLLITEWSTDVVQLVAITTHDAILGSMGLTPDDLYTVSGNGSSSGYSGDGGPAGYALLSNPSPIVRDFSGNILFGDWGNDVVRLIAAGNTDSLFPGRTLTVGDIYTVVGNDSTGYTGDGGPATKAELNGPAGLAVDANGNLLMADANNNVIRLVAGNSVDRLLGGLTLVRGDIYTVIGSGVGGYTGNGGPARLAELNFPNDVTVDSTGNIEIVDSQNWVVREVELPSSSKPSPTVKLSANPASSAGLGYTLRLTATVTGSHGVPTGFVSFFRGSVALCKSVPLKRAVAVCTTTTNKVTVGTHEIRASYGGSAVYAAASDTISYVVKPSPSVRLTASPPSGAELGRTLLLIATVNGTKGLPTGFVRFSSRASVLCESVKLSSGAAICTTSTSRITVGSHQITASYGGSAVYATATDTISYVVKQ
jgi:hypothetical protein